MGGQEPRWRRELTVLVELASTAAAFEQATKQASLLLLDRRFVLAVAAQDAGAACAAEGLRAARRNERALALALRLREARRVSLEDRHRGASPSSRASAEEMRERRRTSLARLVPHGGTTSTEPPLPRPWSHPSGKRSLVLGRLLPSRAEPLRDAVLAASGLEAPPEGEVEEEVEGVGSSWSTPSIFACFDERGTSGASMAVCSLCGATRARRGASGWWGEINSEVAGPGVVEGSGQSSEDVELGRGRCTLVGAREAVRGARPESLELSVGRGQTIGGCARGGRGAARRASGRWPRGNQSK